MASRDSTPVRLTFMRVMSGEWFKLRKQRGFVWSTLFALLFAAGFSALRGDGLRSEWNNDPAAVLEIAATMPLSGISLAGLLFGLGICTWLAGEFVSGSNNLTLLVAPRREMVFLARLTMTGILSLILGGLVALIGTGFAVLFVGPGPISMVAQESTYWASILVTLVISVSIGLLCFAMATLMRRSLSAVGSIAVLFFALPSVEAIVMLMNGPLMLWRMLASLPGSLVSSLPRSLVSNASSVSQASDASQFTYPVACLLLVMWSVLSVCAAAWSYNRYE